MTRLVFVRHGQATNNTRHILAGRTAGIHLTKKGTAQAGAAAEYVRVLKPDFVYSSPIERAHETAEILCRETSLVPVVDERLNEIEMGGFTCKSFAEVSATYNDIFSRFYGGDPEIEEHGVETFASVRRRVRSMMDYALREHPDDTVILVTHMDPIKAALMDVLSIKPLCLLGLIIANASISIMDEHEGSLSVAAINVMSPRRFNEAW